MKHLFFMLMMMITLFPTKTFAKDEATKTSFIVYGNCETCKKKIEKAAKVDGVKSAVWSDKTKIITVSFLPSKISLDQIEKNIANVGYDTDKYKGDDNAYKKLPQCCQYERKK